MHHRRRRLRHAIIRLTIVLGVKFRLKGVLLVASLFVGVVAPVSGGAAAQEPTVLEEINFRNNLIAAQESLLNTYRCLFNIDIGVVPGGCVDGQPATGPIPPDVFEGVPTSSEIEIRDQLVVAQESLLNTYRCLFNVDTEIVPDGCGSQPDPTESSEGVDSGPVPTGNTGRIDGAILTTECTDDRPRGGTLTIGVPSGMKGWDPAHDDGMNPSGATRMTALYDALFYLDLTTGQLVPGLAESITTEDNQVFTLKLREGVNFTDGTPLDADAFLWNVEYHKNPAVRSRYGYQASRISSIEKIDDLTVNITAARGDATFPQIFADRLAWMMSPYAYRSGQDPVTGLNAEINHNPIGVGAGPFMFESGVGNIQAVLVRNPDYFRDGCPYLDKVIFKTIVNSAATYSAFGEGNVDIAHDGNDETLRLAAANGVNSTVRIDNYGFIFFLNGEMAPFNVRACRVAVAHAIDYDTLNTLLWGGVRTMDRTLMAPGSPWLEPHAMLPDYDPVAAAVALEECEAELGGPLEFEPLCTMSPENLRIVETLATMWATVGIKATPMCVGVGELVTEVYSGQSIANTWGSPVHDPDGFFDLYFGDSVEDGKCGQIAGYRNWTRSCFPEFDAALTQGRYGLTFEERYEAYSRFQRKFAEEVPVVILSKDKDGFYWSDEVSGVFMSQPGGILLAFTAKG